MVIERMVKKSIVGVIALVLCAHFLPFAAAYYDGLVNDDVVNDIDVSTSVAKIVSKISINNAGTKAAAEYLFTIPKKFSDNLSYIFAEDSVGNTVPLKFLNASSPDSSLRKDSVVLEAKLPKVLEPKASITILVSAIYTNVLVPFPAEISQTEHQKVRFSFNQHFYSPYTTNKLKTRLKLASTVIESKSEPVSVSGDTLTYGPFTHLPKFSLLDGSVHFDNDRPFIAITRLVKELEVSHWGNLGVEEVYRLRHGGAKHKGVFSRYDFQRNPMSTGVSAIRMVTSSLPASASEIYYRDAIGNISTSHVKPTDDGLEVEIVPRFPILGQWKTEFCFGYNLPLSEFLTVDRTGYALTFPLSASIEGAQVDELIVKIVLPEGASHATLDPVPFPEGADVEHSVVFGFLDVTGRPTITIKKKNLVPEHNIKVTVRYQFSTISLLREPLYIFTAFIVLLFSVIGYVRIDLTVARTADVEEKETGLKMEHILQRFRDLKIKRDEKFDSLENSSRLLIAGKKTKQQFEKEEEEVKEASTDTTKELVELQKEMANLSPGVAIRMEEVIKKERLRHKEFLQLLGLLRQKDEKKNVSEGTLAKQTKTVEALREEISKLVDDIAEPVLSSS
mmetsp:Transcript_20920/g.34493  ORF Transcript_20920/g.34493 Transcript_20920/m.34493 type:complete len:619 (-) Transcript_20920:932-2788(-)|eukprot:CAMPEP_0184346522 /NCGR_PEP_ID=MMETSP1089-20130417/14770_1 /TAXON_ID=38269 ORGANISM="Gloeochaete wittrockiana, Strain SAG46.84" /NCGR_SAMPLE_ID=MMETSP1089 /ASSEMBLY_ACC=CAM_ASM_000445 /LENGTH=618 /DNA_ID=CAMNT_0026677231 /DNA_START=25 /DNA_END=1881 /DNA_ORIENTATION=-